MTPIAQELQQGSGSDRDADRAVAFWAGIGTDLERKVYAEMGDSAFVPDQHGLTPMDYKNGDFVRQEWVKGTRGKPGGNRPKVWLNCNGPRPLRGCPAYTSSVDACLALVAQKLEPWAVTVELHQGGRGVCQIHTPKHGETTDRIAAPSAPRAILLALLAALSSQPQQGGGEEL